MRKMILGVLAIGMIAGMVLGDAGAAVPGEKRVQISLGLSVLTLLDNSSNSKAAFGPGLRVDLNLGRSFFIAPEASAGIGGWTLGGTVNFRSGKFFAGAGYLAAYLGGQWGDWGVNSLWKIQVGAKGRNWLVAPSFVANRWLKGFGLTAGYIF